MRMVFSAAQVAQAMASGERAMQPAARDFLRALAIQTEGIATDLSSGSPSAAAGSYPIPVRTGMHRRAFGFELQDNRAIVFNTGVAARALHDGFKPYGNPHARPIPPRPYFTDALTRLDLDAAARAAQRRLEGSA